ncbi:ComEA family DNA-binding protein [Pseudidiomarina insulisalsae]|uniref:DNA uptake protein n=1 Tax=Pseudidiomarina insulisalsae TaxID=575789 RepID=A0A432YGZ7_9GAMM|nr:helix-hairpin-helix domain-containing protein [Pseudidiomarina insulisalsae]RUO60214.1 DNA uptake protein [Pseudidiomarina insulisalsae]
MLRKTLFLALFVASGALTSVAATAQPLTVQPTQQQNALQQQQVINVNINTASAAELAMSLTGVGQRRAEAIVALREQLGGFTDANQLMQIKGIGPRLIELNKERIEL